jgi:hypothetical protein
LQHQLLSQNNYSSYDDDDDDDDSLDIAPAYPRSRYKLKVDAISKSSYIRARLFLARVMALNKYDEKWG